MAVDKNLPAWIIYEDEVYRPDDAAELLTDDYQTIKIRKKLREHIWDEEQKKTVVVESAIEYLNEIVAYDTEASSWRADPITGEVFTQKELVAMDDDERAEVHARTEPLGCVYAWMFGIRGKCVLFRSWESALAFFDTLAAHYKTNKNRRLIVWVHNLSYEFQWMRKRMNWREVFSVGDREVVRCLLSNGIELRDSLILAKLPLEKVGEELRTYKIQKQVGKLDYELIRTPATPLTKDEEHYCINDCLVLCAYIWEKCQDDGDITKIPMTDTGYVRRHTRKACLQCGKNKSYIKMIQGLRLSVSDYVILKDAFAGGFTHGCWDHFADVFRDERTEERPQWWFDRRVSSNDETSAYPAMMLARKYPMTCFTEHDDIKTIGDVWDYKRAGFATVFRIRIWGLRGAKKWTRRTGCRGEHVLSKSKCYIPKGSKVAIDNGRLISAEYLETAMTDVELEYFSHFYEWDAHEVYDARCAMYGYLPREIIEATLYFYEGKTTLKDVQDKVALYLKRKGQLNSEYGMMVMDIVRQVCNYSSGEWQIRNPEEFELDEMDGAIEMYNSDKNRFTFFAWGVWITAYARARLIKAIGWELYLDHVYCDTDSLKHLYHDRHARFFEEEDKKIIREIEECLDYYVIDKAAMRPKTVEDVEKPIGVWDYEGTYKQFKMCGAKRYLAEHWNKKKGEWEIEATVAGCNKKRLSAWLSGKLDDNGKPAEIERDAFKTFDINLVVPARVANRVLTTYFDDAVVGTVTDYLGNEYTFEEMSGVSMEPSAFTMKITKEYAALVGAFIS